MAFKDRLQEMLQKITERKEEQPAQPLSNRPNGGMSGYQPKIPKRQPVQEAPQEHPAAAFASMAPMGVDASAMPRFQQSATFQRFHTAQQAMAHTSAQSARPMMGPQGVNPQQAQPMAQPVQPMAQQAQPMAQPVQSQPMPQARFTGTGRQRAAQQPAPQQPVQGNGYQPRHQAQQTFPQQQPMQGFTSRQGAQQPFAPQQAQPVQQPMAQFQPAQQPVQPQPARPQQGEQNVFFFPGTFVGEEGSAYKMVLRVAQITGVPSCYRLIEFMQNSEAMIVNAEQISDVMEANRCMDLLFGAAYAMNQNFVRISGRMIYLIAPAHVHVLPFDSMLSMSREDIERRWPGSNRSAQEPQYSAYTSQHRREDFAPAFGRRGAAPNAQAGAYTDYGGFGARK